MQEDGRALKFASEDLKGNEKIVVMKGKGRGQQQEGERKPFVIQYQQILPCKYVIRNNTYMCIVFVL